MDLPVFLTLWVATCIRGSATSIVAVPHHRMQPQKPKPGSAGPAETRTPLRGRPRARWCYRCPPKSAALGTPPRTALARVSGVRWNAFPIRPAMISWEEVWWVAQRATLPISRPRQPTFAHRAARRVRGLFSVSWRPWQRAVYPLLERSRLSPSSLPFSFSTGVVVQGNHWRASHPPCTRSSSPINCIGLA